VYKWELDKGDESLAITVNGSLILDESDLVIHAALDAWVAEDRVTDRPLHWQPSSSRSGYKSDRNG
jgi:hypothetical protein